MRLAGIQVRLTANEAVKATCRIDAAELEHRFHLAPPARYAEYYESDRGQEDKPTAFFTCSLHWQSIQVLHPDVAPPNTPWFPEGASPVTTIGLRA
jgi:hypothetical protein